MIHARQVRVIGENGNQLGIMSPADARAEAERLGLDLVEVAPNASPPVCRIMDYGKYKYQQSKRAKESKKHQHAVVVKEVKYRPKIDVHDFAFKTNHVREFLREGNKVMVRFMFQVKEIKLRPKIGVHDYETKKGHVVRFLNAKAKVKVTIMFRGRETAHPEFGREVLARVVDATKDLCQEQYDVNSARLEGRAMSIVLSPSK